MGNGPGLDFETEIAELESRIQELERQTERTNEVEAEIRSLRMDLVEKLRDTYSSLNPWQTVQVARHKNRPYTMNSWSFTVISILVMTEPCYPGLLKSIALR